MTAENYHLKWDSHLTYLNTAISTLYKNEKFADVILFSSSSLHGHKGLDNCISTVGIPAHKFILSSCSQFFASMFETAPASTPNGSVIYVVLPPDLSHRAIQILVQYMYLGEATVANDILNEVLRGGEILKIRGLCRTTSSSSSSSHNKVSHEASIINGCSHHYTSSKSRNIPSLTQTIISNSIHKQNNICASVKSHSGSSNTNQTSFSIDQFHHQQQLLDFRASVLSKDSPVIIKSSKQISQQRGRNTNNCDGIILINKDIAIDPKEKCCFQQVHNTSVLKTVSKTECTEIDCNSCPMSVMETQSNKRNSRTDDIDSTQRRTSDLMNEHSSELIGSQIIRDDIDKTYDERLITDNYIDQTHYYYTEERYGQSTLEPKDYGDEIRNKSADCLLPIKQEPVDWVSIQSNEDNEPAPVNNKSTTTNLGNINIDYKMQIDDSVVKIESDITTHSPSLSYESPPTKFDSFSGLMCDLCKTSYSDLKSWICHLETHEHPTGNNYTLSSRDLSTEIAFSKETSESAPKTYVPKKKRRLTVQETKEDHVILFCDLCSVSFKTPADWVRHMNSQHTEIELALLNSKKKNNK